MSTQPENQSGHQHQGNHLRTIILRALVIIVIFGSGHVAGRFSARTGSESSGSLRELHAMPDTFINPLIECEEKSESIEFAELRPFKHKISERVAYLKEKHKISHISLYFRDLNNGPWFGIDEKEKFAPASLMKVPMMIASLKIAESHPEFLRKTMVKTDMSDLNSLETLKPSRSIVPHQQYSVEELIRRMIAYSDNNALELLLRQVDHRLVEDIYADLGIPNPSSADSEDYLSVKQYASFLRILFNASYLNKAMSQKALQFLSEVEFNKALVGGIPSEIGIVHKFGERIVKNRERSIVQIHDCGIIYYPRHPYLLCIMSRGNELDSLLESLQDVSRTVYSEVDQQYREQQ